MRGKSVVAGCQDHHSRFHYCLVSIRTLFGWSQRPKYCWTFSQISLTQESGLEETSELELRRDEHQTTFQESAVAPFHANTVESGGLLYAPASALFHSIVAVELSPVSSKRSSATRSITAAPVWHQRC